MIKKLEEIEDKDPKEYWRLINELRQKKQSEANFDTDSFTSFFEKLYAIPKSETGQKKIIEFVLETHSNTTQSKNRA